MKSPNDKRPVIVKRSVIVNGRKTSISLEDAFWAEVRAIASEKDTTISELLTDIDRDRQASSNLSSALRVFVLKHHQSTKAASRRDPSRS
jgi:predicted DNA-binding ribbon-helix-helix protein